MNHKTRTVETHIGNILSKLGVASRAQAVVWVWQNGMVAELGLSDVSLCRIE